MAQLVKTINGLGIASVKSVNGLLIASVKTVLGLDNTSASNGLLNSLLVYYGLNSDATDETGNYDGTATNVTYDTTIKKLGTASGIFNGTSSRVVASGAGLTGGSNDVSMNVWVNADSVNGYRTPIAIGEDTDLLKALIIATDGAANGGKIRVGLIGSDKIVSDSAISTESWFMLTVTYTASTLKLYINGTYDKQNTSTTLALSNDQISLGRVSAGYGQYWDGFIDGAAVWNRTLSADDVTALYNSGSGLPYSSFTS